MHYSDYVCERAAERVRNRTGDRIHKWLTRRIDFTKKKAAIIFNGKKLII